MALYNYRCDGCGKKARKISTPEQQQTPQCPDCVQDMVRDPTGPSSQKMERLDNSLMPRRVERLADAERLHKERSKNE